MAVWVTGDTHIPIDIKKLNTKLWSEGKTLTKNDYLIVCGDFGLLWKSEPDGEELYWTNWLNEKPWTTLFIDGNHENHYRLSKLKTKEMFGSTVGVVSDSIYHLKRGEVYTIENKKFFCMGGALSIDKASRTEGISWWREERSTHKEQDYGLGNLEKHNNKVDYLITHTIPSSLRNTFNDVFVTDKWYDDTCKYLDHIYNNVNFEKGYCGHWHIDVDLKKYTILYNDVIKII